jgi:hypothetical protein
VMKVSTGRDALPTNQPKKILDSRRNFRIPNQIPVTTLVFK